MDEQQTVTYSHTTTGSRQTLVQMQVRQGRSVDGFVHHTSGGKFSNSFPQSLIDTTSLSQWNSGAILFTPNYDCNTIYLGVEISHRNSTVIPCRSLRGNGCRSCINKLVTNFCRVCAVCKRSSKNSSIGVRQLLHLLLLSGTCAALEVGESFQPRLIQLIQSVFNVSMTCLTRSIVGETSHETHAMLLALFLDRTGLINKLCCCSIQEVEERHIANRRCQ